MRPPVGAPNVLVVLIDDASFGSSSAFGGPCITPTFEAVAHALKKAVGEAEGSKVKALKGALDDAQQKMAAPPAQPPAKA